MAAFEQLVERHTAMVFRVAMHIMRPPEDAEDIVQDAFLKVFQHLQLFEERSRFSTWLFSLWRLAELKNRYRNGASLHDSGERKLQGAQNSAL